ncbi:MAG: MBL fold metallo-hydrolase [Gemmatimonadaceae bacterium]
MRVWVLGSGSRGNALLLECGESRVLVDAGFPAGTIGKRLRSIGVAPESLEAVIVTHEHSDHVCGVADGARRFGWTVLATHGTVRASESLAQAGARTFQAGCTLSFAHLDVTTIPTRHDAAEPVALVATERRSGARAGIAYDLGCATSEVRRAMRRLDLLVLESNHDEFMLRTGPYPWFLKRRIASSSGHLSNDAAGELARDACHSGLRDVVLAHLSETNNTPAAAVAAMTGALRRTAFRGQVAHAAQRRVVGPFGPDAAGRQGAQLSLAL